MVIEFESLNNWASIVNNSLAIISITVTVFFLLRKKLYKSDFYKKVNSKIGIYHLKIIENKFLIGSVISATIAFILIIFALLSLFYLPPTIVSHTYYPQDFIQTGIGQGRILDYAFNNTAILVDKDQYFNWIKGWGVYAKLKRMELSYYAPYETKIRVNLINTIGVYPLNGKSTLPIENISLPYRENVIYGMSIVNIGETPVYLFSIKTEEEQKPTIQQMTPIILIGYIFLFPFGYFLKKHRNRNITITPLDELYKDAKLADRIKNIEMELENYQNMLRYIEELNLRKELSPNYYLKKKEYYEEVVDKLTKEKNNVESEINDILNSINE